MLELSTAKQPINVTTRGPEWTPDEFLAIVSHELRNPITAILGWAEVVSAESSDAEISEHAIEVIKRNGSLKLSAEKISLVSILEAAIEMMKPQASAKAIKLEAKLSECPTPIIGDATRLQQVFTNLLSNAIKFTPVGGRVQVRVECRNQAEITVSDTGRGISAEFLPFVFDRYRQQEAETAESGGLGLGLAITRYLVEKHGGTIYANSAGIGKGATFTVCLPLRKPDRKFARQEHENFSFQN